MQPYRVREIKLIASAEGSGVAEKTLREYERPSDDAAGIAAQVRQFFEIELSSPNALQTVDFDAIVVIDAKGTEIARFSVADFWMREWKEVASGALRGTSTAEAAAS